MRRERLCNKSEACTLSISGLIASIVSLEDAQEYAS
jgi:hypothetical protein